MNEKLTNNHELIEYFSQLGYEILNLSQPWRHITGHVRKEGEDYFLKLATSQDISLRTRNEFAWNMFIQQNSTLLPVKVPQPFESGEYNDTFWFTAEFVDGETLADPTNSQESKSLEEALSQIAHTTRAIMALPSNELLPKDRQEHTSVQEKIIGKMQAWQEQIKTRDISPLITFAQQRLEDFQLAPQHGDFVPWHFKRTANGDLYLFDAEAAAVHGIKYYDVAYFYHRVYTKLKRSDLAQRFLQEVLNHDLLNKNDSECLRAVLAQRIVGGYFDAERDGISSIELQDELADKLLNDNLL